LAANTQCEGEKGEENKEWGETKGSALRKLGGGTEVNRHPAKVRTPQQRAKDGELVFQHFDFDTAIRFVLPGFKWVWKEQGIGTASSRFQACGVNAFAHQPLDERIGPS